MTWYFDPHSGGQKIPAKQFLSINDQVMAHQVKQSWYPKLKIKTRFKSQFCYLYAFKEGEEPFPIGRLRYFSDNWSFAFFAYSSMSYKPCIFSDGKWLGTIEDAIDKCSVYLT